MTTCPKCNRELAPVSCEDGSHVAAQIKAMKLRCGVTTDTELAEVIGRTQPAVAMWRTRGAIPEKAELAFENVMRNRAA